MRRRSHHPGRTKRTGQREQSKQRAVLERSFCEKASLVLSNLKAKVSKGGEETNVKLKVWVETKSCTNFYVPLTLRLTLQLWGNVT